MPRSRHAPLRLTLVAALSVLAVASPARAQSTPQVDTSQLDELEAELGQLERDVRGREGTLEELDAQAQQLRGDEAQAQARLDEIEAELSLVVELYNEAVVALEDVQAERAITTDELGEVADEVGALSAAVAEHARRLHKLGPTVEFATMLAADNATDLGFKGSSLRRILTAEQVDLEDLAAARMRLDALEDRLAEQEAEADAAAARVEREVVEVEAAYERHEDELTELTAVLARVEAEHVAEREQLAEDRDELETQQGAVASERARLAEEQRRLEREQREQERREQERREQQRREQQQREQQRREAAATAVTATASSSSSSTSTSSGGSSSGGSGGTSTGTRRSAQVAVDTALAQVGKPYRWGATGPNAFDCSGLTSYSWAAAGVKIPRTSGAQFAGLKKVSRSQLQPGDLVFYHSPISHVAMYVGGDTIVEASRAGIPVRTARLSSRSPVGYARP